MMELTVLHPQNCNEASLHLQWAPLAKLLTSYVFNLPMLFGYTFSVFISRLHHK
uniref:Uncharacterized protein n=1 Tax=Anguilla anguilla TaxID=7936 RepID=A0A0E9TV01_ANGAN